MTTQPPWRAGTAGSVTGTSFSVSVPSGLTAGDLVAVWVNGNASTTFSPPDASWTQKFQNTSGVSGAKSALWWHKATSGDTTAGSWTFTQSLSAAGTYICGAWSGADVDGTPVPAATNGNSGSATSTTLSAITPGVTDTTLVGMALEANTNGVINVAASMTQRFQSNVGSYNGAIGDQALTSSGSTGTRVFTNSPGYSGTWGWVMFAIAPVPPPPVIVSAVTMRAGVPSAPAPVISEKLPAATMRAGVPVLSPPTVVMPITIAAAPMVAGIPSAPAPTIVEKIPAVTMRAGVASAPSPAIAIKLPAQTFTAGHSAMPAPALRWIVTAPAMTAGVPSMPPPLVGEFLRITAVTMRAGVPTAPPPSLVWRLPAVTMRAGVPSAPVPVVRLRLTAATMRAGVPSAAPPSLRWVLQAVTMRAGVPVMPPPTILANVKIFAPPMVAGVPVMPVPQLRGNNGPAIDSQVVTDALSGRYGPVVITWRFEKRSITNQFLYDVSAGIIGCTINLDNSRAVVRTATFTVDPTLSTLDAIADHIAVIGNLLVHYPGNPPFELPIEAGLFTLNVPDIDYTSGAEIVWTIAASDLTVHLVQSTTTDVYSVAAGTNYVTAINTILSPFGFQPASITPTASTLGTSMTWPAGTPWLTVINDLLKALNYYPLFFDRMGIPTSRPMIDNSQRVPDVAYTDNEWLVADIKETTDTTRFANQIVARVNNPGLAPLSAVATNADPASPTSTVTLGRTITQTIDGGTAPDQATLTAIAQQALRIAAGAYRTATISTQIDPRREPHEVYALTDTVAGYEGSAWLADTWKLDVDKPDMQHTATAVIPVNIS